MTMISAYLQAEEIDPSESASFYHGGQARLRGGVVIFGHETRVSGDIARGELYPSADTIPEFYRMLKELSDELDVEAVQDQDSFEL